MINSSYSSCFLSSKVELLPVIKPLSFTVHYVFHTVTLLPTHITADNNVANRSLLVYLFFVCVCEMEKRKTKERLNKMERDKMEESGVTEHEDGKKGENVMKICQEEEVGKMRPIANKAVS